MSFLGEKGIENVSFDIFGAAFIKWVHLCSKLGPL